MVDVTEMFPEELSDAQAFCAQTVETAIEKLLVNAADFVLSNDGNAKSVLHVHGAIVSKVLNSMRVLYQKYDLHLCVFFDGTNYHLGFSCAPPKTYMPEDLVRDMLAQQ